MAKVTTILKRSEQNPADCWSVEDLFPSDEAWEAEFQACQDIPDKMAAYRGRLGNSAATLLEYLEYNEKEDVRLENLYVYTMLRHDEDTTNAK